MPLAPGDVIYFPSYVFPDGETRDKFVVLLALTKGRDWVLARTTSRQHSRPTNPSCFHGDPYPGYHIGMLPGVFKKPTWVVLDRFDDFEEVGLLKLLAKKEVSKVGSLRPNILISLLECCAGSNDINLSQERTLRDLLPSLRC